MTHHLIIVTICGKYLQNPLIYEKVMDRTQTILYKDYVDIWLPSVTLTFEVGIRLLCKTHRLIIVNNCGKYLQNLFKDKKVMDRTRHVPSNRQCWPWMSKCDIDPGGTGLVVAHDTLSYSNKHLCQVISDSFDKWQSYRPDTKVWRTDGQADGAYFYIPLFSSKRQGTINNWIGYLHSHIPWHVLYLWLHVHIIA
jgi:hypothetical protein